MTEPYAPEAMIRKSIERRGGKLCERCKCCELMRHECDECDGTGHYVAYRDEDGLLEEAGLAQCSTCGGCGGWWICDCDAKGEHHHEP